jgi:hypothetical protein
MLRVVRDADTGGDINPVPFDLERLSHGLANLFRQRLEQSVASVSSRPEPGQCARCPIAIPHNLPASCKKSAAYIQPVGNGDHENARTSNNILNER